MSLNEITDQLERYCQEIQRLILTFDNGKMLTCGIHLCLVGSPNVGKSSLMNALLDKERAIVSDIPGTTRDLLEDDLILNGVHYRLTDTAGIHETKELIEQEGIRRSKQEMSHSDLILLVLDAKRGINEHDQTLLSTACPKKTLVVWNKTDLHELKVTNTPFQSTQVSAKFGQGLDELISAMEKTLFKGTSPHKEEVILTNARHKESLQEAYDACAQVINGLQTDVSPEFLSFEMRRSLQSLGKIIGTDVTEDILSSIFSTFCIGK